MRELSDIIEYEFSDPDLALIAMTHRSAAGRGEPTYERLEFLGDRVLALVIADLVYEHYPHEEEGSLAKRLVALVRRETLADVAAKLVGCSHAADSTLCCRRRDRSRSDSNDR